MWSVVRAPAALLGEPDAEVGVPHFSSSQLVVFLHGQVAQSKPCLVQHSLRDELLDLWVLPTPATQSCQGADCAARAHWARFPTMLVHRLAGTECAPSGKFRQTILYCPVRIRDATPATARVPTLCGCHVSGTKPRAVSCMEVEGNSSTTSANPPASALSEAPSPMREVPVPGSLRAFCLRERDLVGRGSRVPEAHSWGGAAGTAASPPPLHRADR